MRNQILIDDLNNELASTKTLVEELERFIELRKKHPTDADLAPHLIEKFGGWKPAVNWLVAFDKQLNVHLRLLFLTIALEEKERQHPPTN